MVSNHGYQRAKERLGYNNPRAEKCYNNAYVKGKSSFELSGIEKYYIKSKESIDNVVRLHNSNVYIYNTLGLGITVYPEPDFVKKTTPHHGKIIFKNYSYYKSWCKNYLS